MSGRRALVAGVAVALAYAALAALSGRLSPLARGPLLDGLGPPLPYRWVSPPPELAATNLPPSSGAFRLGLGASGSMPATFVTSDNQVTVVVPADAIASRRGDRTVRLTVEPVDPSTLAPPPEGLAAFGNAYRIAAAYRPSGTVVRRLEQPLQVILLYPVTADLYTTQPTMLHSVDGAAWRDRGGTHSGAQQQIAAELPAPGYALVAGALAVVPTPVTPPAEGSGPDALTIGLLVLAACTGLLGIGLILRGRGR